MPVGRSFKVYCSLFCQEAEASKFNVHGSASWQMIQSSMFHSPAMFMVLPAGRRFKV